MLTCTLASKLWEKICFRSQRSKPQGDLTSILRLWPKRPYSSPILNTLWQIIPGLLFWSLWKERNRRIFKNQSTPLDIIWSNFSNNLQESLALHSWQEEDLPKQPKEAVIWQKWQLKIPITPNTNRQSSPESQPWTPPPQGIFKLNFDGASKGNSGPAGFGGIFRNSQGDALAIYYGSIGWDTNNSAELEGLWQGLNLAHLYNLSPIIVEWDSQILISIANQLLQGSRSTKVATSWRMASRIEKISNWLNENQVISFAHTKRDDNKVADLLANLGVDSMDTLNHGTLQIIHDRDIAQNCIKLVQTDRPFPDADA